MIDPLLMLMDPLKDSIRGDLILTISGKSLFNLFASVLFPFSFFQSTGLNSISNMSFKTRGRANDQVAYAHIYQTYIRLRADFAPFTHGG